MIKIGNLRNKIKVQKKGPTTRGKDNSQNLDNWADWKTSIWAETVSQTSKEYYKAMQVHADMTILFRTYYVKGLDRHMRILFEKDSYGKDRIFNIIDILDVDDKHLEHLITCKEVV